MLSFHNLNYLLNGIVILYSTKVLHVDQLKVMSLHDFCFLPESPWVNSGSYGVKLISFLSPRQIPEMRNMWDSFYITLTHARVMWEEETLTEQMPPWDWPWGPVSRVFFWWMVESPAYCAWCRPWPDGLGWCRRAGWASLREEASQAALLCRFCTHRPLFPGSLGFCKGSASFTQKQSPPEKSTDPAFWHHWLRRSRPLFCLMMPFSLRIHHHTPFFQTSLDDYHILIIEYHLWGGFFEKCPP